MCCQEGKGIRADGARGANIFNDRCLRELKKKSFSFGAHKGQNYRIIVHLKKILIEYDTEL